MADGSDGMASTHGPASPGHEARHPVPSSRVPGRRSRLRVLDVETGRATVVHESSELLLESVSWPDGGETLIVSAGGAQWGIPVGGGEPQRLGPAPADPVDGATGAAGGGRDEVVLTRVGACRLADGTWIPPRVVRVPGTGGVPAAPADHGRAPGAAPDPPGAAHGGGWAVFDAESYPAAPGHAQLFRMRPDGTGIEQLTHDERVNRFPQVSPDGRLVAYVSRPPGEEGAGGADPLLRLCAFDGSGGRDLARLHGVPGTAGGHCWSPDSLHVVCLDRPRTDWSPAD